MQGRWLLGNPERAYCPHSKDNARGHRESALVASGEASDWASLLEEYRKRKAVEEREGKPKPKEVQAAKKRVTEPRT